MKDFKVKAESDNDEQEKQFVEVAIIKEKTIHTNDKYIKKVEYKMI